MGEALARCTWPRRDFTPTRANALSLAGWRLLFDAVEARADEVEPGLAAEIAAELDGLARDWPQALPAGVIHADLFPDNVFFAASASPG